MVLGDLTGGAPVKWFIPSGAIDGLYTETIMYPFNRKTIIER